MFLSPEQCAGEQADERSDIYSLGVSVYRMLAGRFPFTAPTPVQVMLKQMTEDLTSPRVYNPEIPHPLADIVHKMMEKEPEDRYQSIDELLEDVDAFTSEQTIGAKKWSESFYEIQVVNPDITDEQIRDALFRYEQMKADGQAAPTITDILRSTAVNAFKTKSFPKINRRDSDLSCPLCEMIVGLRLSLKNNAFVCKECDAPLTIVPGVPLERRGKAIGFSFERFENLPAYQRQVTAAVGRLVELGQRYILLAFHDDLMEADDDGEEPSFAWVVECAERVAEARGTLSIIAPVPLQGRLREAGLSPNVRLVASIGDYDRASAKDTRRILPPS
jgi:hypothetical protein